MKKMFLAFLSTALLLSSCGKDGAVGPQGPQGATGATGAQGNANVQSTTITVNPGDWVRSTTPVNQWYEVRRTVPTITQAVLERGLVQVYWMVWPDVWFPLPYHTSNIPFVNLNAMIGLNGIILELTSSDHVVAAPTTANTYRIVTVSPSFRMSHPNVNWNNYAEVEELLKKDQ